MSEYLLLLLGTALVNNVVLVKFLGLCPFMGVSKKLDSALSMGLATTFVLTLAAMTSWLLEHFVLAPLHIEFLRILAFILVIAAVVQFTEMVVHKTSPVLYQILGIFLPLITTNCAVLGVALLNVQEKYGFMQSLIFRFRLGARLYAGDGAVCRITRAVGVDGGSRVVCRYADCVYYRRDIIAGVYGVCGALYQIGLRILSTKNTKRTRTMPFTVPKRHKGCEGKVRRLRCDSQLYLQGERRTLRKSNKA